MRWIEDVRIGVAGVLAVCLLVTGWAAPIAAQETESSVVYLVRHAEKADDDPQDPTLSPEGLERVEELVRLLADVPFTNVFSTPYHRTRLTAAPIAEPRGLEVQEYSPFGEELAAFVETLRTTPGHHLVSGHSNTTPGLVEALGGDPISPIEEDEYDRLYIVTVAPDGTVSSTLIRFGEAWDPAAHGV